MRNAFIQHCVINFRVMLTLPDLKQKNILFIKSSRDEKISLKFSNDNLIYCKNDKPASKVSLHSLFAVFIIGDMTITSVLIRECQRYGISLFLLKRNYQLYTKIISGAEGNYLLRHNQYNISEDDSLKIAKHLVTNKTANQFRLMKDSYDIEDYYKARKLFNDKIKKCSKSDDLLGIEGRIAKIYFKAIFSKYSWHGRIPRAKRDITNFLLDFGYTVMFNYIESLLSLFGFDNYHGYYHKLFYQRKSLVCDIIEPFRVIIDYQIVKSYNLSQIDENDFIKTNGMIKLKYDCQSKYFEIFSQCIADNKTDIYKYVRQFYKAVINNDMAKLPEFKLKKKICL